MLEENVHKNDNSNESISEHLTLYSDGTENDRSFQEIEITNQPSLLQITSYEEDVGNTLEQKSVEQKDNLDFADESLKSGKQSISSDGPVRARSILEEILSNEQFQSDHNISVDNSNEESFNIFGNLNLDDKMFSNYKNDPSVNGTTDFHLPLLKNEHEIEKRLKDFEEIVAVKDSIILALTSELDSLREGSHTNTGSTLSITEYRPLQEEYHNKVSFHTFFLTYTHVTYLIK